MSSVGKNLALSDNGFLFDPQTGSTYSLNATGTLLLRGLINGLAPERLVERLPEVCGISRQRAVRDVEQFLMRVRGLGLIEPARQS